MERSWRLQNDPRAISQWLTKGTVVRFGHRRSTAMISRIYCFLISRMIFKGPTHWSYNVPQTIRSSPTVDAFKRNFKTYLFLMWSNCWCFFCLFVRHRDHFQNYYYFYERNAYIYSVSIYCFSFLWRWKYEKVSCDTNNNNNNNNNNNIKVS